MNLRHVVDARAKTKLMPIKPEEALETIGLDPSKYDTVDAFKEAMEERYVTIDAAHTNPAVTKRVLGKFNGVIERKVGKIAKDLGVDVPKDVDALDLIDIISDPVASLKGEVSQWKEKAEKGLGDDVVKEWEKKVKTLEKERDLFKGQAVEIEGRYNTLNEEIATTKKRTVIDTTWDRALASVPFHSGVNELLKEGFVSKVKQKYQIELDEELKPTLKDAKGNPIKHPKKVGELLTLDEALKLDAKEFKLVADNPHANKPVEGANGRKVATPPPATPIAGGGRQRVAAKPWGMR